jgi:uncharacterized membrane protein (DUF4010 family)
MIEGGGQVAARLAIASLIGLAAGLEREWSGHTSGPDARFAGLRTFFLLGLLGGAAGVVADLTYGEVAAALVLGAAALSVSAYAMAVRRPTAGTDGTTEAAALTIVGLGLLAGLGWTGVAAGAGAIVVLLLSEKARLHWLVRQLSEPELRAGFQFAVLAVVVLPLLPTGPLFGVLAIKPRALWTIVLLFSGLNFAGFMARRIVGASRGFGITGALGGVVSSTAVTLTFSRESRNQARLGDALAQGVLAACTVMIPRVLVVSAALSAPVALALLPFLLPAFLVGLGVIALGWRSGRGHTDGVDVDTSNPLRLGTAIRMAIAFQVAIMLITLVHGLWGSLGLFATASALGLTDMDALTVSMSRPEANLLATTAARAIAIGILSNTLLKLTLVVLIGRSAYRRRAALGLAGVAIGGALGLMVA